MREKKRVLRKPVDIAVKVVASVLLVAIACVNDFQTWRSGLMLMLAAVIDFTLFMILERYGRRGM